MKIGDQMILTRDGRDAEVLVLDVTSDTKGGTWALVRCACGGEFTEHAEHLRPMPRVRVDMAGRVVLSVVQDEDEIEEIVQ